MLKLLGKILKTAAPIILTVVNPPALINTALGFITKHFTKVPNNSIPVLNLMVSVGVCYFIRGIQTGDWEGSMVPALKEGVALMGTSTAIHQTVKTTGAFCINGKSF